MASRNYSYFADIPYSIIREISEKVLEINKRALENKKVIDLSLGQNFLGDPSIILREITWLNESSKMEPILYEPSLGPSDVRESIGRVFYPFFYNIPNDLIDSNNVMITDGAFGAVRNALGAIFRPGDILVIDRVTFRYFIHSLIAIGRIMPNTVPYIVPSDEENGFVATPEQVIDVLERLKNHYSDKNIVYYTQFGFNPTGCYRSSKDLKEIVEYVEEEKNLFLINDIAYHLVRWGSKDVPLATALANEGKGIVDADSLSKPFGLMGARIGALITRDSELFKYAARIQQYTIVSPNKLAVEVWRVISNREILPAVKSYLEKQVSVIKENYMKFTKGLDSIGLGPCKVAQGTIYAFIRVDDDATILWRELLEQARVAVVPAIAFTDPRDEVGKRYIRATISVNKEMLEESVERIKAFYQNKR